jgi:hypothetical protein
MRISGQELFDFEMSYFAAFAGGAEQSRYSQAG